MRFIIIINCTQKLSCKLQGTCSPMSRGFSKQVSVHCCAHSSVYYLSVHHTDTQLIKYHARAARYARNMETRARTLWQVISALLKQTRAQICKGFKPQR